MTGWNAPLIAVIAAAFPAEPPPPRWQEALAGGDARAQMRALYDRFDETAALAECERWLAAHPGDGEVVELAARALRQLGHFSRAAEMCRSIESPSVTLQLLLADCLASGAGTAAEAHLIVDRLVSSQPQSREPRLALARLLLVEERFSEAAKVLRELLDAEPRGYEAQLLAAKLRARLGAHAEALATYRNLLKAPASYLGVDAHLESDAARGAAEACFALQRHEAACDLYRQLLQRQPRRADLHARLGELLGLLDRAAQAQESLARAVELAPEVVEYRLRLAAMLRASGRVDEASAQFEKVIELDPQPAIRRVPAELALAELQLDSGAIEAAGHHVAAALALAPQDARAWLLQGRWCEKSRDFDAAESALRQALELDPLLFDANFRLARLLARSHVEVKKKEAAERFARHERIEPSLVKLQRTLREIEATPRSASLLVRLAGILNRVGEHALARTAAEQALTLAPRDSAANFERGCIAANLGDTAEALLRFERVSRDSVPPTLDRAQLDRWIDLLKRGEPLPLPLVSRE